ncbi:MAG: AbgT family transporter [Phycisphaerales bacterium]|nr:AbgT family transporter [Phycisphaerales bacterium]
MDPDQQQAPSDQNPPEQHSGIFKRFLAVVEWLGNLLPHPVTLFALFALAVVVISQIAASVGLSVEDPRPNAEGAVFTVRSLMSGEGIRWMSESLVTNFTGFVPLGTVLVALLGVGVAERSGLLTTTVRALVLGAPKNLVTVVVIFSGILSNTASEMGYVVLIPLAMAIYHSLGRHPLAGMAAAFAGVSGGYSANLLIGTVDPLLAGITEEAAQIMDPSYEVHPAVNWYFMIASTFMITAIGWFVSAKIVEPRLGTYDESQASEDLGERTALDPVTPTERKGLLFAGLSMLLVVLGVLYAAGPMLEPGTLPGWGVLRNPDPLAEGPEAFRPLLRSVVPIIVIFFVIPGFVYGRIVGTMRNDRDVIDAMAGAMRSMGLYIVLVFFAAQFVAFFNYSGLGQILAVLGADAIVAMNLDNPLVFVPFILMCCFVNLMLGSASAQWAVTAPIFVPMLMAIGYSPEVIQAAYRIGDSTTNIITPMMSYFGLILAVATKYQKNLGIGTMVATMLPYSIFFLIAWTALFYLWVFVLGIPVGPGAETTYQLAAPTG